MSHSKSCAETVSAKSRDSVSVSTRYLAFDGIFGVETKRFAEETVDPMNRLILLPLVLFITAHAALAQDNGNILTLNQAIELALKNNRDAKKRQTRNQQS